MRAGRLRAATLIEVLICCALLSFVMTAVVAALVYCNRYLRSAESKIAAQAECLKTSIWLSRSLSESHFDNIEPHPPYPALSNVGVAFPSPREPGNGVAEFNQGALVWKQTLCCYKVNDPNGVPIIVLRSYPYPSPRVDSIRPTFGDVDHPNVPQAFLTGTVWTRTIARYIRKLEIKKFNDSDPEYTHPGYDVSTLAQQQEIVKENTRTCEIIIGSFLPQYGLDYGIEVRTRVRVEN